MGRKKRVETHDFIRRWFDHKLKKTQWKTTCGEVVDTKQVSTDPSCPDCRKHLRRT